VRATILVCGTLDIRPPVSVKPGAAAIGAVAFVGVVARARAAHAAEYLCYVAFQPGSSVLGSEGNIHFTTYTGPS
jgi:hypothetical protein